MLATCLYGPNPPGYPFNKLFSGPVRTLTTSFCDLTDVDAIVLWGGEDISPALYGQKPNKFCEAGPVPSRRDLFEWGLMQEAKQRGIPLIGVCRGAQIMCAFAGGTLAQDVSNHQSGHTIVTIDGEMFHAPGSHHQMLIPPDDAEVLAWAAHLPNGAPRAPFYIGEGDAITYFPYKHREPEVVYFPSIKGIGFQYHPEWDRGHVEKCVEYSLNIVKEKLL